MEVVEPVEKVRNYRDSSRSDRVTESPVGVRFKEQELGTIQTQRLKQTKLIPVSFDEQIFPEAFEHTLACIIDQVLDLSVFDERYRIDETGCSAYDPAILLKISLYA